MTQWRLAALTTSVLAILAACLPMGALFGATRIVPVGPAIDYAAPHNRERLARAA